VHADSKKTISYPPKKFAGLDELRGVAILLVLILHCGHHASFASHSALFGVNTLVRVITIGWIGVDLFFVLSGFLITTGLLFTKDCPCYFRNFFYQAGIENSSRIFT